MTDNKLKQAIGHTLLPAYREMIPDHDEHEFSSDFEAEMNELIGGRRSEKARKNTSSRARVYQKYGLIAAAAVALTVGVAAVFLAGDRGAGSHDSQTPAVAVQSSSQSGITGAEKAEQEQISRLGKIASELAADSEKFYVSCYTLQGSSLLFQRQESSSPKKASAAARQIGEYLQKADISYLGSARRAGDAGSEGAYEKSVSQDTEKIFSEIDSRWFAKVYSCDGSREMIYTVKDGTGYLRIEEPVSGSTGGGYSYFSFGGSALPLYSQGKLTAAQWESDNTQMTRAVSRQEFFSAGADRKYAVQNCDGSAGFSYSIDNTGDMPAVDISQILLPENETAQNAVLEIYLCKKRADSDVLMNAAMMSGALKQGRYELSRYRSIIQKNEIDGIKIVMRFDTDKHPAPDGETVQSGLKNAYTITVVHGIG